MIDQNTAKPTRPTRRVLPENFELTSWEALAPYYAKLTEAEINTVADLENWLKDRSELDAFVSEKYRWRYVSVSRDTTDQDAEDLLKNYYKEFEPKLNALSFELNQKLVNCKFLNHLDPDKYRIYLRSIRNRIELYREENLTLFQNLNIEQKKFSSINGAMSVEYNGQEFTLQQASKFLSENDREKRETIYRLVSTRRLKDQEALDELFDKLADLRQEVATNAGFDNYRDYKFSALGRFDYTVEDCYDFHEAIEKQAVPLQLQMQQERKNAMGLDALRPWDGSVDPTGAPALKPFSDADELVDKTIQVLGKVHPFFGECLSTMRTMERLDINSRPGKAPGGYNMGMPETGVPFVFMNAAGTDHDVRVMVHEAGHSVHSFLSFQLELMGFRSFPSEMAELASMTMELFTMDYWEVFYDNEEDFKRAKRSQLQGIIKLFPWIATIDKFQHWMYIHKNHTHAERTAAWLDIYNRFHPGDTDWTGLEDVKSTLWQKQLHIYEGPFYYIEYAIAQLGAVAMWKQFRENKQQAIENYIAALKLGYTRSLPELYKTAGIEFRFDQEYVADILGFLKKEYEAL